MAQSASCRSPSPTSSNPNFPAIGGDLLCRAEVLKIGRRVAYGVADVYMEADPDRLVGHATMSYTLTDGWGRERRVSRTPQQCEANCERTC